MRSLLWKEWREQHWKLAFGSLILAAFAIVGLRARIVADEQLLEGLCFLAVLLLPVLSSTGLVPAEREEGTLGLLLALPVRTLSILIIKTLMGALLCAIPLVLTAAVSIAMAGGREVSTAAIIGLYARTLTATLVLFTWMLALTIAIPSETRAALIAMAVQIMWLIITIPLFLGWTRQSGPSGSWILDPFVFLVGFKESAWAVRLWVAVLVQTIIALSLWLLAAWQFARPQEARP